MIPASYLFRDAFQKSFYDPDIADAVQRHRHHRSGRQIFGWLRRRQTMATGANASEAASATDL